MRNLVVLSAAVALAGSATAGVIVPDLNDANAIYDSAAAGLSTVAGPTYGNGLTFAAQITASAADITASQSGTVNIIEVGGTFKGSALMLKDGNFIFVTKNGQNDVAPVLEDTDAGDNMLGITLGAATEGLDSKIWVSFDQTSGVVRYSVNGLAAERAITGSMSEWNWAGNNTLSFGQLDTTTGFYAGTADLGDYASAPYPADNFSSFQSAAFSGTVTRGQYFNEVSAIPEPATLSLIVGMSGILLWTRRLMI